MANSMKGMYVDNYHQITLNITEDDSPSPANAVGTFTYTGISIPVSIHYHYPEGIQKGGTSLRMWGSIDDPNYFVGAAGISRDADYKTITLAVGWAATNQDPSCFTANLIKAN